MWFIRVDVLTKIELMLTGIFRFRSYKVTVWSTFKYSLPILKNAFLLFQKNN